MPARVALLLLALGLLGAACSSGGDSASSTTTTSEARRVRATEATLEGPVTTGEFTSFADPRPVDLEALGYVQEEWFASGKATAYRQVGDLPRNGRWKAEPNGTAPYKTRFVVRRPKNVADFSGTVVVEWLNVSAVEAAPDWAYTAPAITDTGAAWVGVSVQALGVIGGTPLIQTGNAQQAAATGGLKGNNPTRYGSLEHPGDAYAFDIWSQIGAALRSPTEPVLGPRAKVRNVIAAGESQSAAYLTGYIDAIQPITNVFDGFFVHSRGSAGARPDGTRAIRGSNEAVLFRTDLDVPVLAFETETDLTLLKYGLARQPDNRYLRVWETAGTSHADAYLINGLKLCPNPVNSGPQHWLATAAMASLLRWVEDGVAPPRSPDLKTSGDGTTLVRDQRGNVLGGIRTPDVDVPVASLSGESDPGAPILCALFGKTTPFDEATLKSLYPRRADYLKQFDDALDRAVRAGFVRKADRSSYAREARKVPLPVT